METASIVLSTLLTCSSMGSVQQGPIVIESAHFQYIISAQAQNLAFIDRGTGIDYLKQDKPSVCAMVLYKGTEYPATSVSLANNRLTIEFGQINTNAVLRIESKDLYVRFAVESLTNDNIESLVFLNVPLTLKGLPAEPFGACAMSLNLITYVKRLPVLQTTLQASCWAKFGMKGAKVAIVAMPVADILNALKQVLTDADEMPHCTVAGPWAHDIPFNRGSYIFNFGALTESNVDEWIAMAKSFGATQIDHHGNSNFFRFGDFVLDPKKWPEGWDTYRRIVKRLHDAGIGSIFHTYSFFIDQKSKYVTPVPDKRLDAFRTFTLGNDMDADTTEITVNESTQGMTTITGLSWGPEAGKHNSVLLHVGDEIISFGAVSQEPPWRFTKLRRGVFGTKAARHRKGAKVRHLKECYGLLVPDPESTLFAEIAKNHADIVNSCNFDGIYLDAIDGSDILRGVEEDWYWAEKFVFEIQKRLKKPVGMEYSSMPHKCWQFRSRYQAWDSPRRGHKRFIDIHAASINSGQLLPLHLGWWRLCKFDPPQGEPSYSDVIEYVGAKLIGWDAGISCTTAIDRDSIAEVPLYGRAVDILRICNELRDSNAFDETVKAKLREPGKEFSLFRDASGQWRFRPAHYDSHTASCSEPLSMSWKAKNPFSEQPVKFRLEALMGTGPYDDANNIVLADLSDPHMFSGPPSVADGVTASFAKTSNGLEQTGIFTAANSGKVPRNAAWARLDRKFEPCLDLKAHQAIGVWIEGDGQGEIVAIRLESPLHVSHGAVADRYITVDFTGRRFFPLVETESSRWGDYVWNDAKKLYGIHLWSIDFGKVESVSIWYNNLPKDQPAKCIIGPIKALPMVACTVKNPSVTINGKTLALPVEMRSGSYLEFGISNDCVLYGPNGEVITKVVPACTIPTLSAGENQIRFSCEATNGADPRVKLTVISHGEVL